MSLADVRDPDGYAEIVNVDDLSPDTFFHDYVLKVFVCYIQSYPVCVPKISVCEEFLCHAVHRISVNAASSCSHPRCGTSLACTNEVD